MPQRGVCGKTFAQVFLLQDANSYCCRMQIKLYCRVLLEEQS